MQKVGERPKMKDFYKVAVAFLLLLVASLAQAVYCPDLCSRLRKVEIHFDL